MNVIRNYIVAEVLKGVALVLSVLLSIAAFVEFVSELRVVGTANYGVAEALVFVALRIPLGIFDILPAAALLGALLSLGNLSVHRELVVMRASGVSLLGLLWPVAIAGLVLTAVMAMLGESLAPSLLQYAREMRTQALVEDVDLASGQSAWIKDGNTIINLRRPAGEQGVGGGLWSFELGERGLNRVVSAGPIAIDSADRWRLANFSETVFEQTGITVRHEPEAFESYNVSPELLDLSVVRADLLDTPALTRYIEYLRANGLDADVYLIAYWSRLASMVSVLLMTALALPFVFGSLRSAGTGGRLVVGMLIGLGHYVSVQLLENSTEVFELDPRIIAWAPGLVLAMVMTIALVRVR